ncbi:MAG TPA: GMC oxidoreductase [Vicinamibacterales bacterium]|nr:GMC oxidoreductase [Vicinamibacterales bacterium]
MAERDRSSIIPVKDADSHGRVRIPRRDALQALLGGLGAGFALPSIVDAQHPVHERLTNPTIVAQAQLLNQYLQTHDINNLYVMDASSFVSGGCQNPTLTIMALAVRGCDHLMDEMKKGNI